MIISLIQNIKSINRTHGVLNADPQEGRANPPKPITSHAHAAIPKNIAFESIAKNRQKQ